MQIYKDLYPNRTEGTDTGYPSGKAIDAVAEGSGTPVTAAWVNDTWGAFQAILDAAGLSANATPEKVGSSQVLSAIREISALTPSSGALTPEMFGAAGDGVTDDLAAFTLALAVNPVLQLSSTVGYYVSDSIIAVDDMVLYSHNRAKIFTDVGAGTTYAPSLILGYEKNNIEIHGLTLQGSGGGRSGSWTPVGTVDGVGSCVLLAGCSNIKIHDNVMTQGGSHILGYGVGAVYLSSCINAEVYSNNISLSDNAVVTDQWYSLQTGKEAFYQKGTVITNNVMYDCLGRGVVVERLDNDNGGDDIVSDNVIYNVLNAGIQFRSANGLIVSDNVINMANVGRTADITDGRNGLYGVQGANSTDKIKVSGNIILNPRTYGILAYNASKLSLTDNGIFYDDDEGINNEEPPIGILVQNTEANDLRLLKVTGNTVDCGTSDAIRVSQAGDFVGSSELIIIDNNTINNSGDRGIFCDYANTVIMSNNSVKPSVTYGGFQALYISNSNQPVLNGNKVYNSSIGAVIAGCTDPILDNAIENCTVGYTFQLSSGGSSKGTIRGGDRAFDVTNYGGGAQHDATRVKMSDVSNYKDVASNDVLLKVKRQGIPTSGKWGRGDIVENILPSNREASYWQAVTSGDFSVVPPEFIPVVLGDISVNTMQTESTNSTVVSLSDSPAIIRFQNTVETNVTTLSGIPNSDYTLTFVFLDNFTRVSNFLSSARGGYGQSFTAHWDGSVWTVLGEAGQLTVRESPVSYAPSLVLDYDGRKAKTLYTLVSNSITDISAIVTEIPDGETVHLRLTPSNPGNKGIGAWSSDFAFSTENPAPTSIQNGGELMMTFRKAGGVLKCVSVNNF